MTPTLEAVDLTLRYGEVAALDGMTFSLAGGGVHGLLGRNGSGKTSLLSVAAAFRKPTAGAVRVGGADPFENAAVAADICLIREAGDTVDDGESVAEALAFAEDLRPAWDAAFAATLLDRFGLAPRTKLKALSRGQRSALGATLGLASRAPLTMFDESHLGMDAPTRYAFYDALLADVAAAPRTVVVSTHLVEEAAPLFEDVLIIDRGRVVLHEETETLRARGAAVTGPAAAVDRFVAGLTVLDEKRLGGITSAVVYDRLDDGRRAAARAAGLELEPVPLQDLFVHLTRPAGGSA
jgi:ABC-2 type transport system ATP-binding protein